MNDDIRIIKGIAPRTMLVNGEHSPCECKERVTCAYCIQASLLFYGKKIKADEDKVKAFIAKVKRKGLRRSSILLGVEKSTLSRWIKKANVPQEVMEKFAA